jgi:hypothetical protein
VVPSSVVKAKSYEEEFRDGKWYSFTREDADPYRDGWEIFGGR